MNNHKYTPEQKQMLEQKRQAMLQRQKKKKLRNLLITLQVIILITLSVVIACLVFIPGNKTLADANIENPGTSDCVKDVAVINKADYSFMIKQMYNEINSKNAILIDLASGEILAQKFPDEKIFPASITKIMTTIVALEHYEDLEIAIEMPDDMYTYLIEQNASVAGFLAGERVKIIDLLYGVMLPSGADACLSLARSIAGTEQAFAKKMTEKAKEIGAVNTNFTNSTGLHDPNHYTTVKDLSLILTYALKNQTFREIFTTETHTTSATNKHKYGITLNSTTFKAFSRAGLENRFVKGGKTGFTGEACLCLASLGQKNGREYILVTVGAGSSNSSKGVQHVVDADFIYDKYA